MRNGKNGVAILKEIPEIIEALKLPRNRELKFAVDRMAELWTHFLRQPITVPEALYMIGLARMAVDETKDQWDLPDDSGKEGNQ